MTSTLRRFSPLCIALSLAACTTAPDAPAPADREAVAFSTDPVAAIAHGALLDEDGATIAADREFVLAAQAYYLGRLESLADAATRAQLAAARARLGDDLDEAERVYVDRELIRWLAAAVPGAESDAILARSLAVYDAYERLSTPPGTTIEAHRQALAGELDAQVAGAGLVHREARAAALSYVERCRKARVPIPPDWGSADWKFAGTLTDSQEFISSELEAHVYYYESSSPRGTCIALPRRQRQPDGTFVYALLGVICHGVETSKACFWDDANVAVGATRPIASFRQGDTPAISGGGTCTDCHAGNNPFIIHPGTALDLRAANRVTAANWNARNWYDPLIVASLPQNPGPSNVFQGSTVADNSSCAGNACHNAATQRLLPELVKGSGWCSTVFRTAVEGAKKTMPPAGAPAGDFTSHIAAIKARCTEPASEACSPENAKICALADGYCEKAVSTANFRTDVCRWPGVTKEVCQTKTAGWWVTAGHPQAASWPSWRKPRWASSPSDACVKQMPYMGGNVGGTIVAGQPDTILANCSAANREKCRERGAFCEMYKNSAGVNTALCRWPNAKDSATCSTQGGTWRLAGSAWFTTYPNAVRASAPSACMATP